MHRQQFSIASWMDPSSLTKIIQQERRNCHYRVYSSTHHVFKNGYTTHREFAIETELLLLAAPTDQVDLLVSETRRLLPWFTLELENQRGVGRVGSAGWAVEPQESRSLLSYRIRCVPALDQWHSFGVVVLLAEYTLITIYRLFGVL